MKVKNIYKKTTKQLIHKFMYIDKNNNLGFLSVKQAKKRFFKNCIYFYSVKGKNYFNIWYFECKSAKGKTKKEWLEYRHTIKPVIINNILGKTRLKFQKFLLLGLS